MTVAAKCRVGGKDGTTVSGEFDGGYDFDVALGCIFNKVFNWLVSVESAVGGGFALSRRGSRTPRVFAAVDTPGSDVVEEWVKGRFEAVGLVVA